jgi:hypothetical protein
MGKRRKKKRERADVKTGGQTKKKKCGKTER